MAGLSQAGKVSYNKSERLGVAGLALHYANIITQIDNVVSFSKTLVLSDLVHADLLLTFNIDIFLELNLFKASRPTSLPPNMRDTLYNGLPPTVKAALRSRLQSDIKEEVCSSSYCPPLFLNSFWLFRIINFW